MQNGKLQYLGSLMALLLNVFFGFVCIQAGTFQEKQ